jgi:hypothetical protein
MENESHLIGTIDERSIRSQKVLDRPEKVDLSHHWKRKDVVDGA